ncbi:MAG: hypothetical protein H6Q86_2574 [candidate division NC10 bacterium]|nr:hypothetical protein [candidate division NC10 bacterium]
MRPGAGLSIRQANRATVAVRVEQLGRLLRALVRPQGASSRASSPGAAAGR